MTSRTINRREHVALTVAIVIYATWFIAGVIGLAIYGPVALIVIWDTVTHVTTAISRLA